MSHHQELVPVIEETFSQWLLPCATPSMGMCSFFVDLQIKDFFLARLLSRAIPRKGSLHTTHQYLFKCARTSAECLVFFGKIVYCMLMG